MFHVEHLPQIWLTFFLNYVSRRILHQNRLTIFRTETVSRGTFPLMLFAILFLPMFHVEHFPFMLLAILFLPMFHVKHSPPLVLCAILQPTHVPRGTFPHLVLFAILQPTYVPCGTFRLLYFSIGPAAAV